jgi:amino acid transporter
MKQNKSRAGPKKKGFSMADTISATGTNQLRKNSLGVSAVTFLVISAAAPLTAVAGGVPISMLLGNGSGIAGSFLLATAILLVFAVGYVAMARHVSNAGGFYAFAARGLGGKIGGASAMVAIFSYNAMQIGILGLLGAASAGTFASIGLDLPWWVWSFIGIAFAGILGYRQVELSAKILMGLVILEYLIVLIIDAAILFKGGDAGLSFAPFSPTAILSGSPAIGILFCFAAFIGFEATTIYSEEAKDPHTTVPKATYYSVILIGVFYMLTSWLMAVGEGVDKLVPTLQGLKDPTTFLFELAGRYVGEPIPTIMGFLFVSSLFAGVLAFHNGVARYKYVAGREGLLPASVGVTHDQYQSPHVGSIIQTVLAIIVVGFFAVMGMDPVLQLFTWLTQLGTLGILGLMAVTSFSVVAFFAKNAMGESALSVKILPIISGVVMAALFVYIFAKFGDLTGAAGSLGVILPSLVIVAAIVGFISASNLAGRDPVKFENLGSNT